MSEQATPTETPETTESIATLRDEMNAQYAALKESFESALKEKDTELLQLREENKELHRAIVRSAFSDTPTAPKEKTPEEQYAEQITSLAKKTLQYMESR